MAWTDPTSHATGLPECGLVEPHRRPLVHVQALVQAAVPLVRALVHALVQALDSREEHRWVLADPRGSPTKGCSFLEAHQIQRR